MIYSGIALNESLENGRISCSIDIGPQYIIFTVREETIRFPLHSTEISSGGAGQRILYFRHPAHKDWCFYSGEKGMLKDPYLKGHTQAKSAMSKIGIVKLMLIGILVLGLLIISLPFIFKDHLISGLARKVPVEWEQQAGNSIFESITSANELLKDSILTEQVNLLGSKLTGAVGDTAFKFNFYIVNDSTLNAFALPGGNVVINSGLILQAGNVEEVLGVLGHEIAHVTERHHIRGILSRIGIRVMFFLLMGDYELLNIIVQSGASLEALQYDRSLETEADEKGWEYLVKSGIDPEGMIEFFKKLEKESNGYPALSFLSTHPATSERISVLNQKYSDEEGVVFEKVDFDFKAFQERIKTNINK